MAKEEFECNLCGKTFDSEKGLHIHQGMEHKGKTQKTIVAAVIALIVGLLIGIFLINPAQPITETPTSNNTEKAGIGGIQSTEVVETTEAGEAATTFIQQNLAQGAEVGLVNVTEPKKYPNLYKVNFEVQGQVSSAYVSKDGQRLFLMSVNMEEFQEQAQEQAQEQQDQQQEEQQAEIPKAEKASVEMFTMSYCPFGTQIEKAALPVMDKLEGKANFDVKFVDYAMHGKKELDENLLQYCMQEKNKTRYHDYLKCFLKEEDNSEQCLNEVGADEQVLETCVNETDAEYNITELYQDESTWRAGQYPLFPVQSDLNEKYGVQGSPTLVINGETVSAPRNPQAILDLVCEGFTNPPEECNQNMSTATPSSGFGFEEEGAETDAQC